MNNNIVISRIVYDKLVSEWGLKKGFPLLDETTIILEPDGTRTVIPYNYEELKSKVPLSPQV